MKSIGKGDHFQIRVWGAHFVENDLQAHTITFTTH